MGFMISDITSDMFYLVLQESLKTGGGGEQRVILANKAKLGCVVSFATDKEQKTV